MVNSARSAQAWWLTVVGVCMAATLLQAAQETRRLRAEQTFDFRTDKAADFKAQVGEVKIATVEFQNLGHGKGGFVGRVRGSDSETSTTLRTHVLADNPTTEDWELSFTVDFLDKSGKLIDRVAKKSKWDHVAKPLDLDHQILEYVVPLIAQVRIKVEGKSD